MADSEVRLSKAISYATKALGYSELRPNQELAVKHSFAVTTFLYRWLAHRQWQKPLPLPSSQDLLLSMAEDREHSVHSCSGQLLWICPQISETYVVSRGKGGRDDALKSFLRLPVLRSEAAQRMQNTETDAIIGQR